MVCFPYRVSDGGTCLLGTSVKFPQLQDAFPVFKIKVLLLKPDDKENTPQSNSDISQYVIYLDIAIFMAFCNNWR